ncbi:MAG: TetR/AcrR family transcriptional regulator [Litorimonas sp.]
MNNDLSSTRRVNAREKLLIAARDMIRQKGFSATTVDKLCQDAGVTKGAFFHHFKTKEDLGVAVANFWSDTTSVLFADAAYHSAETPLARILAYIDFRKSIMSGEIAEWTCLVGTLSQEIYETSPAIRAACEASIFGHAATLTKDFEAALNDLSSPPALPAKSYALHTQAVLQGAFILAKASGDQSVAHDSIDHLKRYIQLTFAQSGESPS